MKKLDREALSQYTYAKRFILKGDGLKLSKWKLIDTLFAKGIQKHYGVYMSKAVFPGTFDPPTNGHLDIIRRVSPFFEHLLVVVATNSEKETLFSRDERYQLLCQLLLEDKNVDVAICDELVANFAYKKGYSLLIRGVRNQSDFAYELELAHINRRINPRIETMLIPAAPSFSAIRSSYIKSLWKMNGSLSDLVPKVVEDFMHSK